MIRILVLLLSANCVAQDSLLLHYTNQVRLTPDKVHKLSNDNISKGNTRDYIKALSYFQLAILSRDKGLNKETYSNLIMCQKHLNSADTTDYYMEFAAPLTMGVIAKQFRAFDLAAIMYERAIEPSIKYDKVIMGMSAKERERTIGRNYYVPWEIKNTYNLGRLYKEIDLGNALVQFKKLEQKARESGNMKYLARAYREIGVLHRKADMFEEAEDYFEMASEVKTDDKTKSWVYHDWSSLYFHTGDYGRQEDLLRKSISLNSTFRSKVDLGECLLMQEKKKEAADILKQAQLVYADARSTFDNIKLFKHLAEATGSHEYVSIYADELEGFIVQEQWLLQEEKRIGFQEFVKNLEREMEQVEEQNKWVTSLVIASIVALMAFMIAAYIRIKRKKERVEMLKIVESYP